MKRIITILLLSLTSSAYALPDCLPYGSFDNCFGFYSYSNGDEYLGEWKDNNKHGQGTLTFASGNKYVGEFKDGEQHGQGTFTFHNGDEYLGEFKDGKYHGHGTFTFANGTKDSGYFMNGKFVPEICEDMGLSKGTSEFRQCVLKLIDKI